MSRAHPPRKSAVPTRRPFVPPGGLVLALLAVLVLFTQRHALGGFFALDDLVMFQQAAGVRPWPVTAWRWLSGVVWFRAVVPLWGHEPFPYHAASLAIHLLNTVLLYRVARRMRASTLASCVGAGLFGMTRLHFPALFAATSIGELLALTFTLLAWLVAGVGPRALLAAVCMALAVSAKESVMLVPIAALVARPRGEHAPRRLLFLPSLVTGVVLGAVFLWSGLGSGRLGGEAYAVSFGSNLLENVARLFGWSADLVDPIPDLHATTEGAARIVLPLVAVALSLWGWFTGGLRRIGVAWWWLAVLPVLPLPGRTYLHYLYVPLAGFALVVAGVWQAGLDRRSGGDPLRAAGGRSDWSLALGVLVVFALWNDVLLATRLDLRMSAIDWPLDPVTRKSEIARRGITDVRTALAGQRARVLILIPASISADVDLASGRTAGTAAPVRRYALEAVLDGGASVRAFVPEAESVEFVHDYVPGHEGWRLLLSRSDSHLVPLGEVPSAHARFVQAMLASGLPAAALEYARTALADRPRDPELAALRDRAAAASATAMPR